MLRIKVLHRIFNAELKVMKSYENLVVLLHTSKDTAGASGAAAAQCSSMPWMVCSACISSEGARPAPLNVRSSTLRSSSVTNERLSMGAFGAATTLVKSTCTTASSNKSQ